MSKHNALFCFIMAFSLISCGDDNNSQSSSGGGGSTSFKKIYLTSFSSPTGDVGISSFDNACNAGYKALVGGASRHPDIASSGSVDWVLAANTEYRRNDGVTVIGTTNASAVFTYPLTNSIGASAGKYYTGISADWSVSDATNCQDWGSMADDRIYGNALSTSSDAISEGMHNCGTTGPAAYVVCVEQ